MKIVVWKDGSYKSIEDDITHEFENDKDWLTTIEVPKDSQSEIESLKEHNDMALELSDCKGASNKDNYADQILRLKSQVEELESKLASAWAIGFEDGGLWRWREEFGKLPNPKPVNPYIDGKLSPKEEEQEELFYELCKMVHNNDSVDKLKSQFYLTRLQLLPNTIVST